MTVCAVMRQGLIDTLVRRMHALGIHVPQGQPHIAYHAPGSMPGETLKQAADLGHQRFGAPPNILFVLMRRQSALLQPLHICI